MVKSGKKILDDYVVRRSFSGLGLFANRDFEAGEFVIEYTGEKITPWEANKRGGKYLFEINSRWTIDGRERKNIGRYINHSCRPNCEAVIEKGKINIYTRKKIIAGAEFTYHYGKEYFDEYIKPFGCRCEKCRGEKER